MFQTLLLFLGDPAKAYVAGDVQAAQLSSPHRVSDGQRRTRQLPKAKRRVSGSSVQQFVLAALFSSLTALRPAYFAFSATKIISREGQRGATNAHPAAEAARVTDTIPAGAEPTPKCEHGKAT